MKPSAGRPSDEGDDGGDRLDAELAGDGGMVVDVHLDQLDATAGLLTDLFELRRQLLARPAPRRPEIDQHRLACRDSSITSRGKAAVVVSLMTSPAAGTPPGAALAGAAAAPPYCTEVVYWPPLPPKEPPNGLLSLIVFPFHRRPARGRRQTHWTIEAMLWPIEAMHVAIRLILSR
jgi:hypothetical protein